MLNIRNSEEHFQQDNLIEPETSAPPPEPSAGNTTIEAVQSDAGDTPTKLPGNEILQDASVESREAVPDGADALSPLAEESAQLCLEPLSFGERLRNLRAEAGMTVADVAQKVRSSQAFILNLESGDFLKIRQHDHYCKSFIERICLVYQADPDELLEKFDQERLEAGRLGGTLDDTPSSFAAGGNVFAEEDLSEEKSVSPALHLPAILISVLVVMLVVLLISAWVVKNVRERKNVEILQVIEEGLPSLITAKKIPLDLLPIPNN